MRLRSNSERETGQRQSVRQKLTPRKTEWKKVSKQSARRRCEAKGKQGGLRQRRRPATDAQNEFEVQPEHNPQQNSKEIGSACGSASNAGDVAESSQGDNGVPKKRRCIVEAATIDHAGHNGAEHVVAESTQGGQQGPAVSSAANEAAAILHAGHNGEGNVIAESPQGGQQGPAVSSAADEPAAVDHERHNNADDVVGERPQRGQQGPAVSSAADEPAAVDRAGHDNAEGGFAERPQRGQQGHAVSSAAAGPVGSHAAAAANQPRASPVAEDAESSDSDIVFVSRGVHLATCLSCAWLQVQTPQGPPGVPAFSVQTKDPKPGSKVQAVTPSFMQSGAIKSIRKTLSQAIKRLERNSVEAPQLPSKSTESSCSYTVSDDALRMLDGTNWLPCGIINPALDVLRRQLPQTHTPAVYCFSTFFFTKLVEGTPTEKAMRAAAATVSGRTRGVNKRARRDGASATPGEGLPLVNFERVKRWTTKAQPLVNADLIIVPVNECNRHWLLMLVSVSRREIVLVDSLFSETRLAEYRQLLQSLWAWLLCEVHDKHCTSGSAPTADAGTPAVDAGTPAVDASAPAVNAAADRRAQGARRTVRARRRSTQASPSSGADVRAGAHASPSNGRVAQGGAEQGPRWACCSSDRGWQRGWKLRVAGGVTQQADGGSCGVHVLAFADCAMQGWWPGQPQGGGSGREAALRLGILRLLQG